MLQGVGCSVAKPQGDVRKLCALIDRVVHFCREKNLERSPGVIPSRNVPVRPFHDGNSRLPGCTRTAPILIEVGDRMFVLAFRHGAAREEREDFISPRYAI
jgi:hypothetical protein